MPLSQELRAKTAEVHEALDSGMQHAFGRLDQYVAFLRASYRVLSSLDAALSRIFKRPISERSAQVAADLQALGQSPSAEPAPLTWTPADQAEAMGCAYVIEGSSLGGLVVAKIVERQLGAEAATTYLRGHGARTRDLWRSFLSELDAWGANARPEERERAIQGATTTFATYIGCFEDEGLLEARGA
ncbi:MAG TPA: biliverdin-producing heme oxygenase [Polyangiales bacterium]|nr:biliverdin-producing heme oxygenase [Polyangiales bacterium]